MKRKERQIIENYAKQHKLEVMTVSDFVDGILYGKAYWLRANIVGLNLPFDLSRLAIRHNSARGVAMRGGFTLQLSSDRWQPRIQVKHLSSTSALIQFTKPRKRFDNHPMRKKGEPQSVRRGSFIDLRTTAKALTSQSHSLASLADFLKTPHRKHASDSHGGPLTAEYLDYAVNDVQVTWECFEALRDRYASYGLSQTLLSQIISEAGIGKGCLREMGIRPWREMQPEFSPEVIGYIMSAYYGGRSEVRLRRQVAQVLYCDFLSMYPTVCTLMGLWQFVIAKGLKATDSTRKTTQFLHGIRLDDLQRPEMWKCLLTLVRVIPDDHIFPIRAPYGGEQQKTIGLNHLKIKKPMWFTLADCIAAQLLTGKPVKVLRAISFEPLGPQEHLRSICIAGNPDYKVDPLADDFYRRLIDLRTRTKVKLKQAHAGAASVLDAEQQALKITANATSYGIFVEQNVVELDPPQCQTCHGPDGKPFTTAPLAKAEQPGRYFNPLIATLITGAARLMLAISETLTHEAGLDWAMCDTDSMAIAKPETMAWDEFIKRAETVCAWFTPLNPYEKKGPLFKIEDVNYAIKDAKVTDKLVPLHCFAVSAKRYVLFNVEANGRPVIRKASAHGLGHLRAPYNEYDAPRSIPAPSMPLRTTGVERWQYDLWYQIIMAALAGHPDQVDLDYHPALDQPAASRYAATTPKLLRYFKLYNQNRLPRDQVWPFNFMLAFQSSPVCSWDIAPDIPITKSSRRKLLRQQKPIAPYNLDISKAAQACFDRETGSLVHSRTLKTYKQALAPYHLSPESKFLNGEPFDTGPTRRRRIEAIAIDHIGKEANRWEAQFHLGFDENEQIEYGMEHGNSGNFLNHVRREISAVGQRKVASLTGISRRTVARFVAGKTIRTGLVTLIANALRN